MKFSRLLLVLVITFVPLFIDAQSTTLSNGLVGHWKFDSINTLTTPDESGTGNVGTVGTSSRLVSGKFGQALRFDIGGTGQFMTVKNSFGSPTWTVSAWVNPDLPINGASPYFGTITIFSADSLGTTSRMLVITKDSIKSYQTKIADYSFANNPGWRFVTVTYDGSRLSAYVDGVLQGSVASPNILGQNARRYIGTNAAGAKGHIFIGAIDEVRLYNRAISATEINALYTNPTAVTAPTPAPTQAAPAPASTPTTDPYIVDVPPNLTGPNDDPTAFLQGYIDRASTLAVSTGKRVTLKFPQVTWVTDQLRIKEEVIYECNKTVFKKRNDGNGMTNRSIIQTIRMNNGVQGQSPLNYYGNYDNITIRGCTFDSNGKIATPNLVQFADTRNLVFENNTIINNPRNASWSTSFCGRNMIIRNNKLYGGTYTRQDGIHVVCGDNILIEGGEIKSGDDAIALGQEFKGMSFVGEDEGITNVTIRNVTVDSVMARCFNAYYGQDYIDVGGVNRRKIKGVKVTGLKGNCAQTHGIGISILDQQEPDMVFKYRIVNGGSRYNNGTFKNVPTTGGACTLQPAADVVVTNGVITSVKPANINNEFSVGDGCQTAPTLVLTALGTGTGGSVVAVSQQPDNTRIQDISVEADINVSTVDGVHDGITPYGLSIDTGKNIDIDLDINFRSLKGNYRPFYISGCQDCTIKYRQTGQTVLGGSLDSVRFGGTIDNVTFRDGVFIGNNVAANQGNAPIYASRGTAGRVNIINNIFKDIETNGSGILIQGGVKVAALNITGNTFTKKVGATNTYSYNNTSPDTANVASIVFKDNVVTGVDKSRGLPLEASAPTTKLVSSLIVTSDKTAYRLGDTVKASASFVLNQAWVTFLKAKGDTRAEVVFEMKDPTGKFLVEVPIAFDIVNGTTTRTYDWITPATNIALSGKSFTLSATVRDASRSVSENKILSGLSFESSPLAAPVLNGPTDDGVTVIEANVPAGTSPDIFAGVLASQVLQPNQFIIDFKNTKFLSTTTTSGPFPISLKKNDVESKRAEYRINTVGDLNLSAFNAVTVLAENTANVPVKLTVQVNEFNVFNRGYQGYYTLPANSGQRHILVPLSNDVTHCNDVTGTDDCPMSPRQAITRQLYINGTPDKSKIGMLRVYVEDMPKDAEFRVYSMKAMSISYAPQYLKNYIDKYGQNNWVNFPEKITSDAQLRADAATERTTLVPQPSIWDMYGGDKTATGYGASGKFKTTKVDGKWWLVNPLGNLTYLTAVTQVDYTLTPGYIGDEGSTKRGAYVNLDRSGLLNNAFADNRPCYGKTPLFCGGTTWSAYTANIIRKYATPTSTFGNIVERWRLNQQNRLREWGFNSITDRFAKNGAGWNSGVRDISFITQFNMKGERGFQSIIDNRTPDVFDPAFETVVNSVMSTTYSRVYPGTTLKIKDDPYAIGTAPDNEIWWGQGQDNDLKVRYNIVLNVLGRGSSSPSKVAFTNLLKQKYGDNFDSMKTAWGASMPPGINSWEAFQANAVTMGTVTGGAQADLSYLLRKFADKYFTLMKTAIRTHAGEGHLLAGARFAGFYRTPKEVIDSCAVLCDIITINYYNYTTANEKADWDYLLAKDRPILVTEFYFDSPSRGSASASRTQTVNDAAQGEAFEDYARDLLTKPQVIGYSYHDIYDQPLLGSVWSENNLTGFISETDRIYPELVNAAKRVNFNVYKIRGSRPNGGTLPPPPVDTFTLTVARSGNGSVTGAGINCGGDCSETVDSGTIITLSATPTTGNTFANWSGACTGTGACNVTMNAAKTVNATFNPITYSVNVTRVGNGTVSGGTISCGATCQNVFNYGTTVTLNAAPLAGYTFTGWSGACTGTAACTLTMNGNRDVTATFVRTNTAPTTYDLTFTIPSPGTTALVTLNGTDPESDSLTFTPGTPTKGSLVRNPDGKYTYTITAPIPTTPFTDTFNYYASDGKLTSAASKVTINYTITPPAMFTLTVAKVGNGTVTAPGIACGGDCQGDFAKDTNAVLTATPAAGYTFSGWSACTGVGTCSVPMNTAKTVTATFTKINTAPVAAITNATVNTSGVAVLNLVANDKEADPVTYTVSIPTYGIITQTPDKKYTYTVKTPRPTTLTVDKFTYTASDGKLTSAPAEISVTIPATSVGSPIVLDTDLDGVSDGNDLCPGTPILFRSLVNASGCIKPKVSAFNIKPTFDTASRNVTNLELGKQDVAKVKYTQPVDIYRNTEQVDLDTNVIISEKRVEIKSNVVPELNKPAVITFYGVTAKNPKILRNGVECKAPQCIVGPNVNGVVEVTVTGF